MPAYATPNDMLNRFDANVLGDLLPDNGVQENTTQIGTDAKLAAILATASGEVESACLAGGMYLITDLQGLADNAQALLIDLVCSVAMCRLLRRRPSDSFDELRSSICQEARQQINELRQGKAVFGNTKDATDGQVADTTGITTIDVNNLHMWRDQTQNYYPRRNLPCGQN